ncbi:LytTR family transcriptional regulator DNA-binding domain-containing protein [Curtanaerobium respiraculi]|uniref:LytTR family transcriptional regulator DNA-binding domain-containing protein n=2 Tax=Curtanaerobium respiraculi TaxID=2949669 RepID=UPI003D1822C1
MAWSPASSALETARSMQTPCAGRARPDTILSCIFLGGGVLRFRASFAQLQSALSEMPQFYVSARGYLANLDMVEQIEDGEFVLRNGERVPISRRNSAEARAAWADWEARNFDRAHPQSGKG